MTSNPLVPTALRPSPGIVRLATGRDRWDAIFVAFVVTGLALRALRYLVRFPLFTDEAMLANSLLERSWRELTEPFMFDQVAPVPFMWLQKGAVSLLGVSEYSLRLVPLLASLASVLLMAWTLRRTLGGLPRVLAMAIFAVSYYPVRYGAELKPYSFDLLASLAITALAVRWLRDPARSGSLWWLALVGPLAVSVSYPAVFVATGVLTAVALPLVRDRTTHGRRAWVVACSTTGTSFLVHYLLLIRVQTAATSQKVTEFWAAAFPDWSDPSSLPLWFLRAHTGRTFAYPFGAENGGSLLTFLCCVLGVRALWQARRHRLLLVLLAPFGAAFVAASFRLYPYGGSGRISQYMAPAICLLAGVGLARAAAGVGSLRRRRRLRRSAIAGLSTIAVLFVVWSVTVPYRDRVDQTGRDFARWFWKNASRDAVLVCAWNDLGLDFARPTEWVPGVAAYRMNQWIYFERRREGRPPDLDTVSKDRPLRVVFVGSAVDRDEDAFRSWLDASAASFEVLPPVVHHLGYTDHYRDGERLLVVDLVPRSALGPNAEG